MDKKSKGTVTPKGNKTVVNKVDYSRLAAAKMDANQGTLETICTVKEAAGPNGKFGFTAKNWKLAVAGKKRVTVKFVLENGDVYYIPTSSGITQMLLDKEINIKHLAGLPIGESEDGRLWITMEEGGIDHLVDANEIETETIDLSDDFLPVELLDF